MSTPSDTQTGHSDVKEGDNGPTPNISTETTVSCSQLRIVTYMRFFSLPWLFSFLLCSLPQKAACYLEYGDQAPTVLTLYKMILPATVASGCFSPCKVMVVFHTVLRGAEVLRPQSRKASAKNIINSSLMSGSQPTF